MAEPSAPVPHGKGGMEVDSSPVPTKKGLGEIKLIHGGEDHLAVSRYEAELERYERSLAEPASDLTQQKPVGKSDGIKPTYAHLARLRLLLGEGNADALEHACQLAAYEDGRPAEEILQAKSKFI